MEAKNLKDRLVAIISNITNEEKSAELLARDILLEYITGDTLSIQLEYISGPVKYPYTHYRYNYYYWNPKEDGPTPGIKLFPDETIYLSITY